MSNAHRILKALVERGAFAERALSNVMAFWHHDARSRHAYQCSQVNRAAAQGYVRRWTTTTGVSMVSVTPKGRTALAKLEAKQR